jgi:hypothetical protein
MLASRRDALMASLFALPFALAARAEGDASPIDPTQTMITLPDKIVWRSGQAGVPSESVQSAALFGSTEAPGLYYQLVKWFPGYMSIRRVAHTPHYDGVKAGGKEPAVIAICGIGPNNQRWLEPGTPNVRRL